ncbi:hypothetical protein YA0001_23865 [Pseudomonas viridiflava]|uniref:hypothetical protein n=1 Tax=Pseudomonas viridiflava TaxID=33069 RepID=UPI0018E5C050|nr:hypothetical protein [Pseudomonas viridiflava]MBI6578441.1 hypothetical protein [Pseudomonas viridiflava]MBI6610694.1 hypothetical protein [Pseudomonas viridiflava]MBI6639618.1 hypothetical protein [Pseudomonas viridiflava]MBI6870609.1 hypothetical protein [Pseudomonas viridiflava]
MIKAKELSEEFEDVREISKNIFFLQDIMKKYTYNYWLSSAVNQDLLVVSEKIIDDAFALQVIDSAPRQLFKDKPTIYQLSHSSMNFTHVIAVPSSYHGYFNGRDGIDRTNLFLCVPIFRCEFSGDESVNEFKAMRLNSVPTLDWGRDAHPKLRVYFDNPKTGGGTVEEGVLFKLPVLLDEVVRLENVADGFIEITNWRADILEVLSGSKDQYVLIYDRVDEKLVSKDAALLQVEAFSL